MCPKTINKALLLEEGIWKFELSWTAVKPKKITTSIINEAISYDFENSSEVACLVWGYGIREIMEKSYFDKCVKLEFEGEFYNAPFEYDKILRQIYGDYMQLPPIDKRKSHHDFTAYAKECLN